MLLVCLFIHSSVHLSICPFVHLSVCSFCPSLHLSIYLLVLLPISHFVYLSICLSVHLSICQFVLLFNLSFSLFVNLSSCSSVCCLFFLLSHIFLKRKFFLAFHRTFFISPRLFPFSLSFVPFLLKWDDEATDRWKGWFFCWILVFLMQNRFQFKKQRSKVKEIDRVQPSSLGQNGVSW